MPEGDTIHTIASYLVERIEGRSVDALILRDAPDFELPGACTITAVRAVGKHLFIAFSVGLELRSHLGMYGSWHRYRVGEAWKRPRRQASVVLRVEGQDYVCFNAKEVECRRLVGDGPSERRLGPDLCAEDVDLVLAVRRARELLPRTAPLVDVLLDQRVASGIGNVYKNELLFLEGLHPLRELGATSDDSLRRMFRRAHELLRRNLSGGSRQTRGISAAPRPRRASPRYWIYGRRGEPCPTCGGRIEYGLTGRDGRGTVWCPSCQER